MKILLDLEMNTGREKDIVGALSYALLLSPSVTQVNQLTVLTGPVTITQGPNLESSLEESVTATKSKKGKVTK